MGCLSISTDCVPAEGNIQLLKIQLTQLILYPPLEELPMLIEPIKSVYGGATQVITGVLE